MRKTFGEKMRYYNSQVNNDFRLKEDLGRKSIFILRNKKVNIKTFEFDTCEIIGNNTILTVNI